MNHVDLNDHLREIRLFRSRVWIAAAFFLSLILVLISRLYWLQITQHTHFTTLSEENRVKITPIPPTRGLIFDRNGVVLAENLPSYALEITPEQVEDMDATLALIGEIIPITGTDINRFNRARHHKRGFQGVPLKLRLTEEEVAKLAINRYRLPGVEIAARLTRHYPVTGSMSHLVGYVGRINERDLKRINEANYAGTNHIGKVGVERTYEDLLHGSVGYRQTEVNAVGRVVRTLGVTPPSPGLNLHLTIDARLQAVAEQAMGDESGSVVAIDPNNGEVLALVSTPGYDANLFVNGIGRKAYAALRDDPERPLFNRSLRGQYPPGSTVKPFYGLAGVEYGVITPEYSMFCGPHYQLPGEEHKYRDWKKTGHGWTNLHKSIMRSVDVYYYALAVKLGIDRMHEFMSEFGFGKRTGIDIRGELGGLMPSREWKRNARGVAWYPGETVITGIGQGFTLVTPLQLAAGTATLANWGQGYKPHVVAAQENPITGDTEIVEIEARKPVPIVKEANWKAVFEAMHDVVNKPGGTAHRIARGANYQIAGKTGTAQVFSVGQEEKYDAEGLARQLRDHALFMSYAPYEDPQLAVAVIVEHGGHGGSTAAPIARKLLDAYFNDRVIEEESSPLSPPSEQNSTSL